MTRIVADSPWARAAMDADTAALVEAECLAAGIDRVLIGAERPRGPFIAHAGTFRARGATPLDAVRRMVDERERAARWGR